MAGDQPRYELHFHGLIQGAVVGDYKKATQIFDNGLAQPTSLHQLPPDTHHFIGRQEEAHGVVALLQKVMHNQGSAVMLSAVTGMAGVGKSALAIHVAHQLKYDFPDAQLYVNLRGTESQPLEPLEVLANFLRAWGIDHHSLPERLTERIDLYRSLLSHKRVFVLLDNARDAEQIRPLLPHSPTCAVLITTRKSFDLEGAVTFNLSVITKTEAVKLLQKLVGEERIQAEPDAAKTITELCGQLPLALCIAGGALRSQPNKRLEDYLTQLQEERQRLEQLRLSDPHIRAALALSYQTLEENSAHLFRLLGLLNAPNFVPGVTATLLDSEAVPANAALHELVERHLLEPASMGRYRFHDVVRLFARGKLAQEEPAEARQAARLRVTRWYLEMSEMVNLALNPETRRQLAQLQNGKDQSLDALEQSLFLKALNWFEMERTNLLAAVEWAHQAKAWEIVMPLVSYLVNFFNLSAYWSDWERTHRLALEAIRELGNSLDDNSVLRQGEAQTLAQLGNVYSLQSKWHKASECYEQSLAVFGQLSDRSGVAKTLGNLGNVYSRQGFWSKASECYKQSLAVFGELKDRYGEGQTLANMGVLHKQQNQDEKAVVFWQEALSQLPSDLPKSKRLREWIDLVKYSSVTVSPNPDNQPTETVLPKPVSHEERSSQPRLWIILGGLILMIAIAIFLIFLR